MAQEELAPRLHPSRRLQQRLVYVAVVLRLFGSLSLSLCRDFLLHSSRIFSLKPRLTLSLLFEYSLRI